MSITVFVRTQAGVHDVEVAGTETVGSLYKKAASAADLLEGMFKLIWEGEVLDRFGDEEIQRSGLVEGTEVQVKASPKVSFAEICENPELKQELGHLVAADPDLVLEIDVGDLPKGKLDLKKRHLPSKLQGLIITDTYGRVSELETGFLYESHDLTSLVFRGFTSVRTIGNYFLCSCCGLRTLEFGGFTNVTSIGIYFMYSCWSLENLDLSVFANVTTVGKHPLEACQLEDVEIPWATKRAH